MGKRIYLFDLDGTLADTCEGVFGGIRYAMKKLGEPLPKDLKRFLGPPLVDSFMNFCGMDRERAELAARTFREYYAEKGLFQSRPYPGIEDTLRRIKERGDRLMVATCKTEKYSVRMLESFGFGELFEHIVGSIPDGGRITKEEVVAEVLSRCGSEGAVMVGDRGSDVTGARANGIDCIGVLYGYGSKEELAGAGARWFADRPEDIAEL